MSANGVLKSRADLAWLGWFPTPSSFLGTIPPCIPQRLLRFQHGFDRPPSLQTARFGGCSLVRAVEAVRWSAPRLLGRVTRQQ